MGHEIENIAQGFGHQIACVLNSTEDWEKYADKIRSSDIVMEFSWPQSVVTNVLKCFEWRIPIVVGTTGWYDSIDEIRNKCIAENQTMFVAANFSIGVNIMFALNKKMAHIMNRFPDYTIAIEETHHTKKLDAPSGTAITLANDIIPAVDRINGWKKNDSGQPGDLVIHSVRKGDVAGIHRILYESDLDQLEIKHMAKGRQGFASGAIKAAEWVQHKTGFFQMQDMLGIDL